MLRMTDNEVREYSRQRLKESREETAIKPKRLKLKRPEPTESAVLGMILRALKSHPKVVWAKRINVAAGKLQYTNGSTSQFMRFGFPGMTDLMVGLTNGKTAFIEVKRPSGRLSTDQAAFIEAENKRGGIAFVARSVEDIWRVLDTQKNDTPRS